MGNFRKVTNGQLTARHFFSRHGTTSSTAADILDASREIGTKPGLQNGFSYADVSSELGITKAALHYHFAGKAELGESLITRYNERFDAALAAIDATEMSAPDKLLAYCDLYRGRLRGQRMCLCGMLAAEYNTLGGADARRSGQVFRSQPGLVARTPRHRSQGRDPPFCWTSRPSCTRRSVAALEERCWWPARTTTTTVLDVCDRPALGGTSP